MPNRKRILLVEDNLHDIELTLAALEENRLASQVVVVRDGQEALDYLYRSTNFPLQVEGYPVVVLLDLKLPKIDGLEVLAQLKSDPQLKRVPVVMLTSSREERDLIKSYDLGVNAYVVKPVDFLEFVDVIKQLSSFWVAVNQPPPGSIPFIP